MTKQQGGVSLIWLLVILHGFALGADLAGWTALWLAGREYAGVILLCFFIGGGGGVLAGIVLGPIAILRFFSNDQQLYLRFFILISVCLLLDLIAIQLISVLDDNLPT